MTSSPRETAEPTLDVASGFAALRFDDDFVRALPMDPRRDRSNRQVTAAVASRVAPVPAPAPRLLACSREMAEDLGLALDEADPEALAQVLVGNHQVEGMRPYAACYGGHQFGHWAGQLGDGRAITLGEVVRGDARFELQLKGAGETPYSRMGDGLAVLRSSVREFLCSEAVHHLGIPTTRALSLVTTGQQVMRDMFYDGNARLEQGAVVCRVAPSFLRFGSYEIHTARRDVETLRQLADYTITRHFSDLGEPSPEVYAAWFEEVARRTARLITEWMRVGFVHGVMNTDNMSILGLTIDYGPYGWLDDFDPGWTPNTSDAAAKRYRYGNQPHIGLWNLVQLANALSPLIGSVPPLEQGLDAYVEVLNEGQQRMMANKLGLLELRSEDDGDARLVDDLVAMLVAVETDMTLFYRGLAEVPTDDPAPTSDEVWLAPLRPAFYRPEDLDDEKYRRRAVGWLRRYAARVREDGRPDAVRRVEMNAVNPLYVLRNCTAQLAIDAAEQGDASVLAEVLEVMRRPYDPQPGMEKYAARRPEWARHRPGCSRLSCSS